MVRDDMLASVRDHDVAVNWTKGGVRKEGLQGKRVAYARHCSKGILGVWIESKSR
jgi:hypothetical protein